jgi:hypothetical protein
LATPSTTPPSKASSTASTTELIRDRVWRSRSQLELAVEYVAWFNNERLHTSLGDVPPAEFAAERKGGGKCGRVHPDPVVDVNHLD